MVIEPPHGASFMVHEVVLACIFVIVARRQEQFRRLGKRDVSRLQLFADRSRKAYDAASGRLICHIDICHSPGKVGKGEVRLSLWLYVARPAGEG